MRKLLVVLAFLAAAGYARAGVYEEIIAAANSGENVKVVDLLKRGMDVNTADSNGSTLLMIAARNGNHELLEILLANRASVTRRNQFGDTALMLAALKGWPDAVRALIDKGSELNPSGWTPLHYSVFSESDEVVALLLARGAKVDSRAPNGQTALMLAVKNGKLRFVRQLIEADADMDLTDFEGLSALHHAKTSGLEEIVAYLRGAGAVE